MAYDAASRRVVLLGGADSNGSMGDTWVYGVTSPAATQTYGAGCVGSNGTPLLDAFGTPWLGNAGFALDLSSARPATSTGVLFSLGAGNVALGGGCAFLLDPATTAVHLATTSNASGFASVSLPLTSNPSWIGLDFYTQAVVLDSSGPFGGLALSNGLKATLGE